MNKDVTLFGADGLQASSRWLTFILFFVNIALVALFVRQELRRQGKARYQAVNKVEPSPLA
jgi:purine-cytosine permease-like protein